MIYRNGFTLIELMVVIVVIGILSASIVPKFINLSDNAKRSLLRTQAVYLIKQDNHNLLACKLGNSGCVDVN